MIPTRTRHGQERHQHRSTNGLFEALLLEYGTRTRSHGADIVILDKPARNRIRAALGGERGVRVFDRYWNAAPYLVVANDNRVITTGYRNGRIKRRPRHRRCRHV